VRRTGLPFVQGVLVSLIARASTALAAAVCALAYATSASAAPPAQLPDQADEHARIVSYWTPERVARAVPRELLLDGPNRVPFAKGGSAAGSGSGAVTGTTWNGGGDVRATTGKVLFTMAGGNYVCSGSVVRDSRADVSLVLSAGHCVYDDEHNAFATNWMFIPDYQSGGTFTTCSATAYGCWTASALVTNDAWAASDLEEDYGFAVVGPNAAGAGNKSGVSSQLDVAVGGSYVVTTVDPGTVHAFGYPAAGKYRGRTLTYCSGGVVADPYGAATHGLKCDMTGGSSGGGWFLNFTSNSDTDQITSLNSYGYVAGPYKGYMFGPNFDADTLATHSAADGRSLSAGNLLVDVP
jgi:hypothetical protein